MIGFYGAVGQRMCQELDNLPATEIYPPTFLAFTTEEPDDTRSSVRIYCNAPHFQFNAGSGSALAVYGHMISPDFVENDHARQLLSTIESGGLESIRDLDGFYSLVYVNGVTRELTLLRDQWGANTIYYISDERGLAFSTSITDLVRLLRGPVQANLTAAHGFLLRGEAPPDGETFFACINQLPMRSVMTIGLSDDQRIKLEDFHTQLVVSDSDLDISFDDAVRRARTLLRQSLENCLRHSTNTGFTLSGGVDSSACVMLAKEILDAEKIHTYSYVTNMRKSIDEERYIDIVNTHSGASGNKLQLVADDYFRKLPTAIESLGTPISGTSQLAQYMLYEMTNDLDVDTMINGVEADSAFCGHAYFLVDRFIELVEQRSMVQATKMAYNIIKSSSSVQIRTLILECLRRLPAWLSRRVLSIFHPTTNDKWLAFDPPTSSVGAALEPLSRGNKRRVQTHMMKQLSHDRHLRYAELCGSAFSVYSRTPFLSREMNEFLLSLPSSYLISPKGETKQFLRAVVDGIVPKEILERRDKIGFEAPTREWFTEQAHKVQEYLDVGVEQGILAADHNLLKSTSYNTIARAISYIEWARVFSVEMTPITLLDSSSRHSPK